MGDRKIAVLAESFHAAVDWAQGHGLLSSSWSWLMDVPAWLTAGFDLQIVDLGGGDPAVRACVEEHLALGHVTWWRAPDDADPPQEVVTGS